MEKLVLFLTVVGILILFFTIYIVYAKVSKPPKWPWHKTTEVVTKKSRSGKMRSITTTESSSGGTVIGGIGVMLLIILFIGLFVVMIYFSIKMTMERYKIAGQAIKQGNTGVAAMVLAPEIGEGVGAGVQGLFGKRFQP